MNINNGLRVWQLICHHLLLSVLLLLEPLHQECEERERERETNFLQDSFASLHHNSPSLFHPSGSKMRSSSLTPNLILSLQTLMCYRLIAMAAHRQTVYLT
jgi:hypothetical protein